nr:MAG TPA: hypothetical protein [Caudoviricetes sp.]
MANWIKLKKAIADVIKTNGNEEITGAIMQQTLISIVDNLGGNAQFGGVAVPSTVPADTDGSLFYLASTQGTYTNFSNINVDASEMAVFTKDASGTWVKTSLPIEHPTIKKPLLIGGNVAAVTKGTGVVLSVPTLNADGTETASELSIEAATPANNGAMTKDHVNTLEEVDDFYTRMTDFVVGDNDDAALINIETTEQNSISLKYKTLDTVNGSKEERTKTIPAVSPGNGTAGAAGMNLIHDIPYFFDFYESGFTSLPDGSDITKILIPKFQTSYDVFDEIYTDVPEIQSKIFAYPKAGDRIRINATSGAPGLTVSLWAIVTSAQLISNVYSVTVDYDGDTYIFAFIAASDMATLTVPWSKVSSKRNIYSADISSLTSDLSEADIKRLLTPVAYKKYSVVYPVKPQTGDLMEEVTGDDESRFIPITVLRNQENPDEYTDIIIPYTGKDNRVHEIVLKNDLSSVQSSKKTILENYRRRYDGKLLMALDTVKAETIENSISDAYSYSIEQIGNVFEARLPKVGDLITMNNTDVPVCEVLLSRDGVQHTRWFYTGKLYEVVVNTALTRLPEDPKVIYDTTYGPLRDLYISAGAKYNEMTGYYELNGLTDITEEEMRTIYNRYLIDIGTNSRASGWLILGAKIRTNLPCITRADIFNGMDNSIYGTNVEVLRICAASSEDYNRVCYIEETTAVAHQSMPKLKKVIGIWRYNSENPSKYNFGYGQPFSKCPLLEEIRMGKINKSHTFAVSPNLSKESVQYMITNANPPSGAAAGSIAITLHPTAYARLKDDADIVAALEAKGGIVILVSA